jgi:hypothetical protein
MILSILARAKSKGTLSQERQLKSRSRRLSRIQTALTGLQAKVKRDLRSTDPDRFLTALAVGLMTETGEDTVGSRKKNVHLGDDGAYFRRGGKKRMITNGSIVRALADAYEAKEDEDEELFAHDMGRVTADMVGQYLSGFKINMSDVRGMLASAQVTSKLQKVRAKGPELPRHKRSRSKLLTGEFMKVLGEVADDHGLEAEMLRYTYLPPGLEASFMTDGTVENMGKTASSDLATRVAERFLSTP